MNITIFNEKDRTTTTLDFDKSTVEDLLTHLNINSETVLVTRNNEILTEDELLNNDDTIEILSVVSGG
ncbi:MoaD/ThiS family protein [Candidatus Woesearchaeota archaeon]|jgi:sulfur carrier protein|nr:MoaD/ThiS family protein [Candidatus Woesearchaeota archaeon]MBT4151161.1 MoaD/ThiS family protein [Candidatus Woesearchaeota archaeon]MBT4247619.1 MoaD/ThiS family protein [Candidatus Woesearchaeota archaeon]MBT4433882.1 MoaD/ThiS family protein [Candidatus Woesearchaeota archaeon]MBT7331853.1 MoaD/ThiS family protein [Candidatus Woesearchaeota archaeon]